MLSAGSAGKRHYEINSIVVKPVLIPSISRYISRYIHLGQSILMLLELYYLVSTA